MIRKCRPAGSEDRLHHRNTGDIYNGLIIRAMDSRTPRRVASLHPPILSIERLFKGDKSYSRDAL